VCRHRSGDFLRLVGIARHSPTGAAHFRAFGLEIKTLSKQQDTYSQKQFRKNTLRTKY
jgi:hypothetical protein